MTISIQKQEKTCVFTFYCNFKNGSLEFDLRSEPTRQTNHRTTAPSTEHRAPSAERRHTSPDDLTMTVSETAITPAAAGPHSGGHSGAHAGGIVSGEQHSTRQRGSAAAAATPNAKAHPGIQSPAPGHRHRSTPGSAIPLDNDGGGGNDTDSQLDDDESANKTKSGKRKRTKRRAPEGLPSTSLTLNRLANGCRSFFASSSGRGIDKKKVVSALYALVALYLVLDFALKPPEKRLLQQRHIKAFLIWVQTHPIKGLVAYVVVYAFMVVLLLPGTPLTIGSGYIYKMAYGWGAGVAIGSIFSTAGSLLGSVLCFCLGRYLMKDTVRQWVRKSTFFSAIDDAVGRNGFKIMALLYLSPILPLGPVSYMCGTTSMKLSHFAAAKVACVPLMVFYVFLGASAGTLVHKGGKAAAAGTDANADVKSNASGEESDQLDHLVEGESTGMIIFAILLSMASMALISHFVKKELMKVLNEQKAENEVNELAILLGDGSAGGVEMAGGDSKKSSRRRQQVNGHGHSTSSEGLNGTSDDFHESVLAEEGVRVKDK
jgi:uncharacterized membrane protein YdjX (TVP38/TMEM64 family)